VLGISKQAVHQYQCRLLYLDNRVGEMIADAEAVRAAHPGCGVEKMYYILRPDFIGRDRFIEIMMMLGFRLKRPKNHRRTTYAGRTRYPNLIKGMQIQAPSVVWQSDITYLPVGNRFYYAVFIIDVYSKKIVGYKVSESMRATANVGALAMALNTHEAPQIHHSDRGGQYSSLQYVSLLKDRKVRISMGLKAQENAYAERINRTIKEEYIDQWKAKSFSELKRHVRRAVTNYNETRPHNHLEMMTPNAFENRCLMEPDFKRPKITIFDDNNP
jgi:transposase InsO family protein